MNPVCCDIGQLKSSLSNYTPRPIVRSNITRALAEAAIPVPGGYANDLAELKGA